MLIKPQLTLEVPEQGDPFVNDVLGRDEVAVVLTDLVSHIEEPFVFSLVSSFGTGKTSFLKMWTQHLKNNDYHCISFNAWENDFIEDPLAALIGVINPQLSQLGGKDNKKTQALFEKTKKIGSRLIKRSIPLGVKLATQGLIDIDKGYEAVVAELSEKIATDVIDSYKEQTDAVELFRLALAKYALEISKASGGAKPKPLIFLIDELDRCRPTFAIELLERIKHFFNIPGIVFILAYDRSQLDSALRTIYGQGLDTDGYLRRFIDLEFTLPKPSTEDFVILLFKKYDLEEYFEKRVGHEASFDRGNLKVLFVNLFAIFNFSLRKQEQCFLQLSIVIHTIPYDYILSPFLLAAMIVLKAAEPDMYYKFVGKREKYKAIIKDIINRPGGNEFLESHEGAVMEAYLAICNSDSDERMAYLKVYEDISKDESLDNERRARASTVRDVMKNAGRGFTTTNLSYITKKLELLEKFHNFNEN